MMKNVLSKCFSNIISLALFRANNILNDLLHFRGFWKYFINQNSNAARPAFYQYTFKYIEYCHKGIKTFLNGYIQIYEIQSFSIFFNPDFIICGFVQAPRIRDIVWHKMLGSCRRKYTRSRFLVSSKYVYIQDLALWNVEWLGIHLKWFLYFQIMLY